MSSTLLLDGLVFTLANALSRFVGGDITAMLITLILTILSPPFSNHSVLHLTLSHSPLLMDAYPEFKFAPATNSLSESDNEPGPSSKIKRGSRGLGLSWPDSQRPYSITLSL